MILSNIRHLKSVRIVCLFLTFVFLISSLPTNSKVYFLEAQYYQDKTQDKKIILGKAEIISSDSPISRIAVSDPSIADLQILNEKQVFVRAKKLGTCTFLIWEKGKPIPSRFDISVWPDIAYLTKQLQALDKNIMVEYIPPLSSVTGGNANVSSSPDGGGAGGASGGAVGTSSSATGGDSGAGSVTTSNSIVSEKIILTGDVANAEVIAKALQIAGAYVDDQGIRIISQPGGQIIDGLAGQYDLHRNSDGIGAGGSASAGGTQFNSRDLFSFTSNSHANLSRSVIVTTQRGRVLSFLVVNNPPQISVAIRFYEISRSLSRDLGFNQTFGGNTLQGGAFVGGNNVSNPLGGVGSIAGLSNFSGGSTPTFSYGVGGMSGSTIAQSIGQGITGAIFNPNNGIGLAIQALQQRGEVKALAEPTLVISNGEPASFLAGGEVPIQRSVIVTGGAGQDISYEPFGIRFSILPTITTQNKIHLQLIPEIRDIDTELSNLVAPAGSTILRPPAFKTRRTQTQVELESGQAFAISGLLREDNTRSLRKIPGAGDIPILGSLFRSKSFRKGETELLIVVSPKIIGPSEPNQIAQLDRTTSVPYHEFDEFPLVKKSIKQTLKNLEDEKGPNPTGPLDAGINYPNQPTLPPQTDPLIETEMIEEPVSPEQIIKEPPTSKETEIKKPETQSVQKPAAKKPKIPPVKKPAAKKPETPPAPKTAVTPTTQPIKQKAKSTAPAIPAQMTGKPAIVPKKEESKVKVKSKEIPQMIEKPIVPKIKPEIKLPKEEHAPPAMQMTDKVTEPVIQKKKKLDVEKIEFDDSPVKSPVKKEELKIEPSIKKSSNEEIPFEKEQAKIANELAREKRAFDKEQEYIKIATIKKQEEERLIREKEKAKIAWEQEQQKITDLKKQKEEARIAKQQEHLKIAEAKKEKLVREKEQALKDTWEKETANFLKAQEAMRLARENTLINENTLKQSIENTDTENNTKNLFKSTRF